MYFVLKNFKKKPSCSLEAPGSEQLKQRRMDPIRTVFIKKNTQRTTRVKSTSIFETG